MRACPSGEFASTGVWWGLGIGVVRAGRSACMYFHVSHTAKLSELSLSYLPIAHHGCWEPSATRGSRLEGRFCAHQ